jgi:hypothetical protein
MMEKEKLCNCGAFDLPHLPCVLCSKFYPTDQTCYDDFVKNQDEHKKNLEVIKRYEIKLLDKIDKMTVLDYVWECYYDDIDEMVVESHVN